MVNREDIDMATPCIERRENGRSLNLIWLRNEYNESAETSNGLSESHDRCSELLIADIRGNDNYNTTY